MKNIDLDMQGILDQMAKFKSPPIESLDYGNARNTPTFKNAVEEMAAESATTRAMNVAMPAMPEPVGKIEHILIPTREGGEVLARVFTPDGDGPFPVLVYFHGGGWVIANLDVYESSCRALCNAAEAVVVSVNYRMSPEAKYPAAVNDAYDATQWVIQNAATIGGDAKRVAVAGESAGGNLATVACLMAKDKGGRMPIAQLLVYPVTDTSMSQASYAENVDTQPLHTAMMTWFWNYYLENEGQKSEKYVAPLLADNLSGMPPTILITAEHDPLRDEGEQYAQRLADAGISVKSQRFDGVVHEFFGLAGAVSKAKDALTFAADGLKEVFDGIGEAKGA
ncbi:MAG: alpha/beta hydrolase [Pyrinomonadaceae bacterium]|nr:alpha/beta hydrolase [Pyrinomonadaceae bacterium]